ncbi:hypothetical protein [Fulvivirga aurantia]|nr:hypothetical protein [Fulvivirga aurantia]
MEQYIGDGANLFITIVACLAGFGAALNILDVRKTKEENKSEEK